MNIVTRRTANTTPEKSWNWEAFDADKLDLGSIVGHGATDREALLDYLEQKQDQEDTATLEQFIAETDRWLNEQAIRADRILNGNRS